MPAFQDYLLYRRTTRLSTHDYQETSAYLVTVCTYNRACLFGTVDDGTVLLSSLGQIVQDEWETTPRLRPEVSLDAFVVMPNHVHGIIMLERMAPSIPGFGVTIGKPVCAPRSLSSVIRGWKSAVTRRARNGGMMDVRIWQERFYETVIWNEQQLEYARAYIVSNPVAWTSHKDSDGRGPSLQH